MGLGQWAGELSKLRSKGRLLQPGSNCHLGIGSLYTKYSKGVYGVGYLTFQHGILRSCGVKSFPRIVFQPLYLFSNPLFAPVGPQFIHRVVSFALGCHSTWCRWSLIQICWERVASRYRCWRLARSDSVSPAHTCSSAHRLLDPL